MGKRAINASAAIPNRIAPIVSATAIAWNHKKPRVSSSLYAKSRPIISATVLERALQREIAKPISNPRSSSECAEWMIDSSCSEMSPLASPGSNRESFGTNFQWWSRERQNIFQ